MIYIYIYVWPGQPGVHGEWGEDSHLVPSLRGHGTRGQHHGRQHHQHVQSHGAGATSRHHVVSSGRPDRTFAVDWALKTNYLSIYLSIASSGSLRLVGLQRLKKVYYVRGKKDCVCVCICLSVRPSITSDFSETVNVIITFWHSDCPRHDNPSCVHYIDLHLRARSHRS